LNKQLENPEFKAEYEKLRPEYEAIITQIAAKIEAETTRKQPVEKIK